MSPETFEDSDSVIGDTFSALGGQACSSAQWLQERSCLCAKSKPSSSVFQPLGGLGGGDLAPANVKAGRQHSSMSAASSSGSAGAALDFGAPSLWPLPEFVDSEFMHKEQVRIVEPTTVCKFTGKPKYWVELQCPNALKLKWVYSVPCGDCPSRCGAQSSYSWIFLTHLKQGDGKAQRAADFLSTLGWTTVSNRDNKRFICPKCHSPQHHI